MKTKETMNKTTYYKSEKWLNSNDSPSTGSVVCYDGYIEYAEGESPCTFIEIADCHQKVRLHRCHTDSLKEFIEKIDKLSIEINKFKCHLENKLHK